MNNQTSPIRQKLLDVAEDLALRKGFWSTSFADICQQAGINRGNFYYYFKTKEALLNAVIERRLEIVAVNLAAIEKDRGDPRRRVLGYIDNLKNKADVYSRFGCPVGSLVVELAKRSPAHVPTLARAFDRTIDWLEAQFAQFAPDPRDKAMHVHQVFQGAIVQAAAWKSSAPLELARRNLTAWVNSL